MNAKQLKIIKETGSHFTPASLADFIANKLLNEYQNSNTNKTIRVLDPACGDGELLISICKIARELKLDLEVIGVDSNEEAIEITRTRLEDLGFNNYKLMNNDFLEIVDNYLDLNIFNESVNDISPVDIIIANPPYVRTQVLGADKAQELGKKFGLRGRVDLYQIFLVAMTELLKINGTIGVITSNRYLNTKGGKSIRKFLVSNYDMDKIYDLGDTKFFSAAVLPAIFFGTKVSTPENLLEKQSPEFLKIYEEQTDKEVIADLEEKIDLLHLTQPGFYSIGDITYEVITGKIVSPENYNEPWVMASKEEYKWISKINNLSAGRIDDYAKVRVGVKTTADKVFISSEWDNLDTKLTPENDLLYPLVSAENAEKWTVDLTDHTKKILYPHMVVDGKRSTVDLNKYPKSKQYLESHRVQLEGRKYVIKANRKWFEIWVPHDPDSWIKPKVVLPDISTEAKFFYDEKGVIVDGNCYWILPKKDNDSEILFLIMGMANSKFMRKYHDIAYQNKLYSGRRRYLTQYVKNYPLPNPDSIYAQNIIKLVKNIVFDSLDSNEVEKYEEKIENEIGKYFDLSD
ncbi:modification methylase [Dolosigranulum pigrum]|uniref:Eco57I restriction-modification methylase domain-containing protein n=1 Tax=Dolosigranulum pigrum TaxID=29394 RepID=UPI000DBFB9CE|nr:N-6 DNA methylase [Dolosigranulum pigrum]RAN55763.1 modification methylase [Dolosigranulum pigrum]